MVKQLDGKVAVVIGATAGMALATAKVFALPIFASKRAADIRSRPLKASVLLISSMSVGAANGASHRDNDKDDGKYGQ